MMNGPHDYYSLDLSNLLSDDEVAEFSLNSDDQTYKKSSAIFTPKREIVYVGEHPIMSKEELQAYFYNVQSNNKDYEVRYWVNGNQTKKASFDETFKISNILLDARKVIDTGFDLTIGVSYNHSPTGNSDTLLNDKASERIFRKSAVHR